ncbi:MAG: ferritin family protein [Candidatus Methanoperedens sp.]|nr:ferritin family protein [Candidatus Methanoperedens sp.]PKL54089.1 MAG: hypothetical protein CVV36_03870 [Candidatus Methanoperedenaceae archaeon HGW-Methanoperedenaceae-1]
MNNTENKNSAVLDILKEAISIEIYGQEYYSLFSDIVKDESAKALFRGLSRDEGEHREMIEKEYGKISGTKVDVGSLAEENREKARRIFPESPESMGITETNEVLKLGIRTEQRSIEFYSGGAQKTGDESVKKLFMKLSGIEKGHKSALENALYYFEQGGSWYGYSPPTLEG